MLTDAESLTGACPALACHREGVVATCPVVWGARGHAQTCSETAAARSCSLAPLTGREVAATSLTRQHSLCEAVASNSRQGTFPAHCSHWHAGREEPGQLWKLVPPCPTPAPPLPPACLSTLPPSCSCGTTPLPFPTRLHPMLMLTRNSLPV